MRFLQNYRKSVVIGILIIIACILPSEELKVINYFNFQSRDLLIHFIMFFIFSALLFSETRKYNILARKKYSIIKIVILTGLILAFTSEFLQLILIFINRTASMYDFLFDILGILSGILAASVYYKVKN